MFYIRLNQQNYEIVKFKANKWQNETLGQQNITIWMAIAWFYAVASVRDTTPSTLWVAVLSFHPGFRGNEPLMRNAWRSGNFFDVHFRILMSRACSSDTEL